MTMLSRRERNEIRGSHVLQYYLMDSTFDLVTHFYPDQQLTITVDASDIMNIMNCDLERAGVILKKAGKKAGKEYVSSVRMSELCDYLNIDDMLIQVFLASLSTFHPSPPVKRIAADVTCNKFRKIEEVRDELQQGILPSHETFQMRLKLWDEQNPLGEPMYKRAGFYRVIIRPFEIAQIIPCHLRTAQELLKEVRKKAELPERAHVSVKKFCDITFMDEEDVRRRLAEIHGDNETDDDDD